MYDADLNTRKKFSFFICTFLIFVALIICLSAKWMCCRTMYLIAWWITWVNSFFIVCLRVLIWNGKNFILFLQIYILIHEIFLITILYLTCYPVMQVNNRFACAYVPSLIGSALISDMPWFIWNSHHFCGISYKPEDATRIWSILVDHDIILYHAHN